MPGTLKDNGKKKTTIDLIFALIQATNPTI